MVSVAVSRRHSPPRLGFKSDAGIVLALLLVGLALAGLAAVELPLGDALTTAAYVVD